MGKKKKKAAPSRIAAQNRRARHDYEILEEFEAGICLLGTEVKSLRDGKGNLTDSYADPKDDAVYLLNAYIPEYRKCGEKFNHDPLRPRKLLLHMREIKKLSGKVKTKGLTLIALDIHWTQKGIAKVKLGLAKGKTKHDKRQSEKDRDWQRDKSRIMREK